MSDITKITEVLEKAKPGLDIVLKCNGSSSSFDAYVTKLGTDKVQAVNVEDWTEDWPPAPVKAEPLCFTAMEPNSTIRMEGSDWSLP